MALASFSSTTLAADDNIVLPLLQVIKGEAKTDTSVYALSTAFQWTNNLALGTKNKIRIHNAEEILGTAVACSWQVKVVFHAVPGLLRTTEPGHHTRGDFDLRTYGNIDGIRLLVIKGSNLGGHRIMRGAELHSRFGSFHLGITILIQRIQYLV